MEEGEIILVSKHFSFECFDLFNAKLEYYNSI